MKIKATLCCLCLAFACVTAHASPVLIVGTPSDSYLSPAVNTPSPNLHGTLLNFDSLSAFATYSTYTQNNVSIFSPDGLVVLPYSTQSGPNELYDNSALGSANIDISLTQGAYDIGVGIADSDPVTIMLQALGAGNTNLGNPFSVTITETGANPGNGYFVIGSSTPNITGLLITEAVSNANYSGLAIDDVQVSYTPEPSSLVLMATGLVMLCSFSAFKLKRA
jgi:hypothetical protein